VLKKFQQCIHCTTIDFKGKGVRSIKEDLVQQQANKVAEDFIEKFRVKGGNTYNGLTRKVRVHVMSAGVPEKALMVRQMEKDGVLQLAKSFRDSGIHHPMEIIGVIWVDGTIRIDPNNFQVDLAATVPPRPINIVCGLHRTSALQMCHRTFPKKALYMYLDLTLLVLPRTVTNINTLLWIGNADNKKSQILVKTSQWSVVAQYRRQIESIQDDPSITPEQAGKAFSAYKQLTAPQIPFEANTLHTFSAVASVDASVFALMEKIFNGEFVLNKALKGQKKPEAVTHFTSMSGIPPDLLCKWLQRVLDGETLTKHFQKRCKIWTKNERVSGQLLEFIQTIRNQYQFSSIDDVGKVFPAVLDTNWFDAVVNSCGDAAKSTLSPHARKMIEEMIANKEEKDRQTKVLLRFFAFNFVRFFVMLYCFSGADMIVFCL